MFELTGRKMHEEDEFDELVQDSSDEESSQEDINERLLLNEPTDHIGSIN
jgi:hypothetical protein